MTDHTPSLPGPEDMLDVMERQAKRNTPAVPELVAWGYVLDGKVYALSPKQSEQCPHGLVLAAQMQALADRLEKTGVFLERALDRATTAEAALAEARKVMVETRAIVCDGAESGFNCHDGDWAERLYRNNGALTQWLSANPAREAK